MSIEWPIVLAAATAVGACRQSPCHELTRRPDDLGTASACVRAYERADDSADALSAADAYHKLQRDDEALATASHLLGGSQGPAARRLVARIHLKRQHFELARPLLEEALRVDQDRGDHAGAYADAAALVTAYWMRNEFGAALTLGNLACAEAEASGNAGAHATSLIALGSVFQAIGDYRRALEAYTRASAELPATDRAGRARVLLYRGLLLSEQRQHALAEPLLEEARALAAGIGDSYLVLSAEVNLADIALGRHDLDTAARHLDRAQAASRAGGAPTPSRSVLVNRAILARYRGDLAEADVALDAAGAGAPPPEDAWMIAQERGQVAAARHDVDAAERSYLAAIEIVEQMWRTSSPEDLKAPFFEDRWRPYQSLFALRMDRNDPEAAFAVVVSTQGRMFLAEAAVRSANAGADEDRRDRLRSMASMVAASPLARPLEPMETLAALSQHYVLNYFAGGGRMRLLVLDRGKVRVTRVDLDLADLEKLVDDYLARPEDPAAARALGDAVLPSDVVAGAPTRFHVIPDGPLLRVPFAALLVGGSRLVEHHELAYAPSATALAGIEASARTFTPAALLGDARNDLAHGAEEVTAVVAATHAHPLTGRLATIAALRAAGDASLLHVIGHSGVDHDGGYLVLSDGRATAAEILAWHIRPHLVVLTTCASAVSHHRDMWGSLAGAFLAAGSTDVVATMFSVEDRAAAAFTRRFYRLNGVNDPVGATAAAQRELARSAPIAAWSAFLVVGL